MNVLLSNLFHIEWQDEFGKVRFAKTIMNRSIEPYLKICKNIE